MKGLDMSCLVHPQSEIDAYISDSGFLCITGIDDALGRDVMLMVAPLNIEIFMLNLQAVIDGKDSEE